MPVLIKKQGKTNKEFGCNPKDRSIETLIHYGMVNINKQQGPTSHQISDYVQRILHINKAGHSGTLDPNTTGCLVMALDKATRIIDTLLKEGKEYVCLMHIHSKIPKDKTKKIFKSFLGKIEQLPPIRSAIKRQLRTREIYDLKILEMDDQDVLFRVKCQAGTYIRKLCLVPETELLTSKGIKTIKELYEDKKNLVVYTYNNSKLDKNTITDFQRLNFTGNLIEITTKSGIKIKVTPEHKLLIATNKENKMKLAKDISEEDFIVRATNIQLPNQEFLIADLLDDGYLIHLPRIKEKCIKAINKKFGSVRAFYKKTKIDRKSLLRNSNIDIKIKHLKLADVFEEFKPDLNCFKTEKGKIISTFPHLTKDLLYLIGLVASDGNNSREKNTKRYTRIKFHNNDMVLINKFYHLTKSIFPNIKVTKKKFRGDLWQVETSNSLFATVCANLGVFSPSYKSDFLKILNLNKELIASFLKGYFDGDGTAYFKVKENIKGVYSEIRFISVDFINLKRIHQMLLKLGIQSKILKKKISVTNFNSKNNFIYEVILLDPASKLIFLKIIGSNHPNKKRILENIKKYFKEISREPFDYLYGSLNKDNKPNTIYSLKKSKKDIPKEFIIEKIRSIKKIPYKGLVYDVTVEENHNFLIENGVVSSNCHDLGLAMGTKAHMQSLIRTQVGPFNDKNWHSLHDLKDAYETYKEGDEKLLREIIVPIEFSIQTLPKIWVFDNTVDTLCHGADLSIPGISKLDDYIEEKDLVAILTLKNELICLGESLTTSKKMYKNSSGRAIKTKKVFMDRKTYS